MKVFSYTASVFDAFISRNRIPVEFLKEQDSHRFKNRFKAFQKFWDPYIY